MPRITPRKQAKHVMSEMSNAGIKISVLKNEKLIPVARASMLVAMDKGKMKKK